MSVELEFCDHCTKIIPAGQTAHIWVDEVICGGCNQILRSVTEKQPASQDSMAPIATHKSQWRSTHHQAEKPPEKYGVCPHCRHRQGKNNNRCANCGFVATRASTAVLPL